MKDEPKTGLVPLLLAKAACCGGLFLVATETLSGLSAWLLEGGAPWLGMGGLAVMLRAIWQRQRAVRAASGHPGSWRELLRKDMEAR